MNKYNFIEKSKSIHGDKFNYSKFKYTGSKNKSILICNTCNIEFLTTPSNNLLGNGCKNCYNVSKVNSIEILSNLESKNNSWSFNLKSYKNRDSDIYFICNNGHNGISTYRNMIRYNVCKRCDEINSLEKKQKEIENNRIKILEYISDKEIKYKCETCHHISKNNYRSLTYNKYRCKYCSLLESSELLKNKKIKLLEINSKKIKLECNNGHIYTQDKSNLLSGRGCNECRIINKVINKDDLISLFNNIHGDYFKYNIDNFKNVHCKIDITCRKGHEFKQKVSNHLQGKGCSICRESSGERFISNYLDKKSIFYIRQKKFKDCFHKSSLPFDFYLPDMNTLIEYDGIQHFEPVSIFGGTKEFEKTKIRDKIKNEYCKLKNIHLIRISYLEDIEERLSTINKFIIL